MPNVRITYLNIYNHIRKMSHTSANAYAFLHSATEALVVNFTVPLISLMKSTIKGSRAYNNKETQCH